ncbi:riboflavin synthase [Fulvivirga kasyanovii]|uniref:Riboflavin synthase n=1 Tax=Fulvivirga kasyanovii TaxID=396812 RepID=A0ABW9RTH3_9BACT|nr:riboflavin synthase [Fulvivirga kasyanovii]MTI26360.1 riboflavin synthase [Fulvivirga kasyanovii]
MFTGIIEALGVIKTIQTEGSNKHFEVESTISDQLKIDQSVSHNGVCLTVTKVEGNKHWVTAIDETLKKTNIGDLKPGAKVNLERCMLNNGRFDGHIVQGHVDQVATCKSVKEEEGSWVFGFEYNPSLGNVTVEKGSITINGISLTCFNSRENAFSVAIIPYTYEHTNMKEVKVGSVVNLEFDIIGKYVQRLLAKG